MKCPNCLNPVNDDCDKPETYIDVPIGMFHCANCGMMQVAGVPHINCDVCNGTGEIDITPKYTYDYDEMSDVLYITFGEPKKCICEFFEKSDFEHLFSTIAIRKCVDTKEINGITIVNFKPIFTKYPNKNIVEILTDIIPKILDNI